jgi:type IV fimbrial biogenesis protein FimT
MMNLSGIRYSRGVTMLELLATIIILGVLTALAIPAMQEMIKNNRITSQNNEVIALINLARNEAIRRNLDLDGEEDVVLRLDADGDNWEGNISVTTGETTAGCPVGVIRCIEAENVVLTPQTIEIRFDSRGYLGDFTETVICLRHADPCVGLRQHRALTILPSGRVESVPLACNEACPPEPEEEV